MSRRRRRVLLVAAVVLLALPAAALLLAPPVAASLIRTRVLPKVAERIGRAVKVGAIRVRWGRVELDDVEVDGAGAASPVSVPRLSVAYDVAPLLAGHAVLSTVTLEHPRVAVVRGESGEDNVSSILERLKRKEGAPATGGGGRVSGPSAIVVEEGALTVEDADYGAVEVKKLSARIRRDGPCHAALEQAELHLAAGPSAKARSLAVDFTLAGSRLDGLPAIGVEGGEISVWKGFSLTGVAGGVTPDTGDPTRANIDLRGGYGGVDRVLWDAKGYVRPSAHDGEVTLNAARFDLSQLRPILVGTPIIDPELAEVDASMHLRYHRAPPQPSPAAAAATDDTPAAPPSPAAATAATTPPAKAASATANGPAGASAVGLHVDDVVDFSGRVHLSGLSVFHPMLGPLPVRHLGFDATAEGTLAPKRRTVKLTSAKVDFRGVRAELTAYAEKLGKKPAFDAWLAVAPVPCQVALAALPAELTPSLQGFKLQGQFKTEIHLAVDLSDLTQGVDLGGSVGIDGCKVLEAPEASSSDKLLASFDQAVEMMPGEWLTFTVGPDNPDWVPFDQISPYLVNSIITTEDSTFMRHKGFIPSEFSSALKSNLEHGYFHLGASSITMQMVKNILLSREKTLSRKLQELFLTWYVEHHLSKERILEIYFNAIEFGPGIYGIGRAARHYFGKPARELEPREAVWFSSILPNPKRRYVHFCKGAPDQKWELYLNRILNRMHQRGRLTDEEYAKALDARLTFNRAEAPPEKECLDLIKRATTPLPPLPGGRTVATEDDGSDEDPAAPAPN